MLVFSKYKYNVKTCMNTISPLYQIMNFYVILKATYIKWDPYLFFSAGKMYDNLGYQEKSSIECP